MKKQGRYGRFQRAVTAASAPPSMIKQAYLRRGSRNESRVGIAGQTLALVSARTQTHTTNSLSYVSH